MHRFAFATLVALGTTTAATSVAPLFGAAVGTAHAADFGGKIKRIRIRPTNTPKEYKVIVVVKDDVNQQVKGVELAGWEGVTATTRFTPTNGGPQIDDVTGATWTRQRRTFTSVPLSGLTATTLTVSVGEESVELDLAAPEDGANKGAWVAGSTDTYSVSARIQAVDGDSGQLAVRVQGMRKDENLDSLSTITVSAEGETFTPDVTADVTSWLSVGGTTTGTINADINRARAVQRFGATDGRSSLDGYAYDYTTTLTDAEGNIVDTATGSVTLADDDVTRGVCSSKVKQKNNGKLKHTVFTTSNAADSVYSLDVTIGSRADGGTLLATTGETSVDRERHFTVDEVAFDGTPAGEVYSLTVSPYDAEGSVLGAPVDLDVSVGANGEPVVATWGEGLLGAAVSGDSLNIALAGDTMANAVGVEVTFNEPFDGPAPISNPLVVPLSREWTRFVQTARPGDADLTEGVDVEVVLYDESDGLLDEVTYGASLGSRQFRCPEVLFKPSLIGLETDGLH